MTDVGMGFHDGRLWVLTTVEISMVEIGGWGDQWSYGACSVVVAVAL